MRGCLRVLLGITIALSVVGATGYAAARYLSDRFDKAPPKPIFPEEQGQAFKPLQTRAPNTPNPRLKPTLTPTPGKPTTTPAATPTPTPSGKLAFVTWPEGLVVRDKSSFDARTIGGIDYNTEVYVLEETTDKAWQKIKTKDGKFEGWVRGGNTQEGAAPAAPEPPPAPELPPADVAPEPAPEPPPAAPYNDPAAQPAPGY